MKADVATPLELPDLVDERSYRRLRALSVSTVEELLGLIAADPDAVAEFLPDVDLPQVQADAEDAARSPVLAEFGRFEDAEFAMGAWAPEDVEVEERASPEYVKEWLDEAVAEGDRDQPPAVNLIDRFPRVRDQRDRGTCVAHTVCAVLECQLGRLTGDKGDTSE